MAISNVTYAAHTAPTVVDKNTGRATSNHGKLVSAEARSRAELNTAILKSAEAQIGVKDQPLALILRSAIEKINEQLEPSLGPGAIETAAESGLDITPQATADRIVELSTAFFHAFSKQNPGEDGEELMSHFLSVISKGIDQGFSEAKEILGGLGVLEGDIGDNISLTYELVQDGLENFRASQMAE